MNQSILFVDRLCSDGLEGGRGHREGKGRDSSDNAAREALSRMELVGPSRGLPVGSFLCWLDSPEHADRVSRAYRRYHSVSRTVDKRLGVFCGGGVRHIRGWRVVAASSAQAQPACPSPNSQCSH